MVTYEGEIQGTVGLNTAMERLEDVISSEFVGTIDVFVDEDTTSQPKGNWIHIKEAAMPDPQVPTKQAPAAAPMAFRQLIPKIIQSAKTIEKPRVAAMPPSEPKPALPTPVPPSPPRSQV